MPQDLHAVTLTYLRPSFHVKCKLTNATKLPPIIALKNEHYFAFFATSLFTPSQSRFIIQTVDILKFFTCKSHWFMPQFYLGVSVLRIQPQPHVANSRILEFLNKKVCPWNTYSMFVVMSQFFKALLPLFSLNNNAIIRKESWKYDNRRQKKGGENKISAKRGDTEKFSRHSLLSEAVFLKLACQVLIFYGWINGGLQPIIMPWEDSSLLTHVLSPL